MQSVLSCWWSAFVLEKSLLGLRSSSRADRWSSSCCVQIRPCDSWLENWCSRSFGRWVHLSDSHEIILTWTWRYNFLLWLGLALGLRSFPWHNTCYIFMDNIGRGVDIIISWANCVILHSSKAKLVWLLLNELSHLIFFIAENREVTWDWRWILNSLLGTLRFVRCT